MSTTSETSLNKRDGAVDVIKKFNDLEKLVTKLISKIIEPPEKKANFVEKVILHNSIINFGAKIKILKHTNGENKWFVQKDFDNLHKLANIRNAFAHSMATVMPSGITLPAKLPVKFELWIEQSKSDKVFELKSFSGQYNDFIDTHKALTNKLNSIISTA